MFFPAQDGECHRKSHDIAGCAYRSIRCGKNASFRSRGLQTGCRGAQHFAGGDANTPADSRWLSRRMGLWPGLREANLGLSEARRWGARRGHLWRVCGVLRLVRGQGWVHHCWRCFFLTEEVLPLFKGLVCSGSDFWWKWLPVVCSAASENFWHCRFFGLKRCTCASGVEASGEPPAAGTLWARPCHWPHPRLQAARRCLFTTMDQLRRKLTELWTRYPWKLIKLPDPLLQENAADLFFQAPACFLDCFSLKLRTVVQSKEALLHEDTLKFLAEVFDRAVPTSTCIERDFARLNRWCDRKGPKPKLSRLAAKHVVYHFRRLTETWRLKAIKEGQICKLKE